MSHVILECKLKVVIHTVKHTHAVPVTYSSRFKYRGEDFWETEEKKNNCTDVQYSSARKDGASD